MLKKKLLSEKKKIKKADFPTKFIDSVIKRFENNESNKDPQDDFIILRYFFQEPKPRILVEFLFCEFNERKVSIFRKTSSFFPLENKNFDP